MRTSNSNQPQNSYKQEEEDDEEMVIQSAIEEIMIDVEK